MYRFKSALKFSKLDQSLSAFIKKYKTNKKTIQPNIIEREIQQDSKKAIPQHIENSVSDTDLLKQKYLLSKAKQIDLNDKDKFSHFNRAQQLSLDKYSKKMQDEYNREIEVLKLQKKGELLIDDSKLPASFLSSLDKVRRAGQQKIREALDLEISSLTKNFKYRSVAEWKKYNRFQKPMINKLKMEQFKDYPGTKKGRYPMQDEEGFTQWFNENHSSRTVESVKSFVESAHKNENLIQRLKEEKERRRPNLFKMFKGETSSDVQEPMTWQIVTPGTAILGQETMIEQYLKGDPQDELANSEYIRLQTHIPDNEVAPLPDKHPLEKQALIEYLERWSFYRSLQSYEIAAKYLKGDFEHVEGDSIKAVSINTYYQLLPKYIRENPNIKNIYRGLEFANNNMSIEDKEKALNFAAKMVCPFDPLNDEIFTEGADGHKEHVSRFDEERLIQDQENDCVDQAIQPDATFKYAEQRQHTPRHVAPDDVPLPNWSVDKLERFDDLPVDYYINDDGFWDEYIEQKEQRHLTNSPISPGKSHFKHI